MEWSTALPDWESRILRGRSLVPCAPLFPDQAASGLDVFNALRVVDVPGSPTMGEISRPWIKSFVASIFGAYSPDTGRRLIQEFFLLISKKNSKALALDTPIPTPDGWTTMGELAPGDTVFGADGKPCRVMATSEVFADHQCYRLRFSNGETVVADAGHLWLTKALVNEPGSGGGNHGDLRQRRTRIRTTQEIAATLFRPHDGARNHSMLMPAPIQCEARHLPIAPYTLGAWLGDGHSDRAWITCHDDDAQILTEIEKDGFPTFVAASNGSRAKSYWIGPHGRAQEAKRDGLIRRLREMEVLNDKHIPAAYFRSSFAQRLALLQGLMDTDGCANRNGRCLTYVGKSERLVRDVGELLATFGLKYSIKCRPVKCNGRPAGDAWFVQFMAFRDELPVFRLTRKLDRMRESGKTLGSARSRTVQIVAADEIPSVPVKCITVDSPDRQFLFGRSMLPTHNSTTAAGIMLAALVRNWRQSAEYLILSPTIEIANNSYYPARDMVRHDEELSDLFHVQDHTRTITHRETGASLKVIAADNETVGGKKATGILIDELWLFGKRANAENMLREATGGLASRPEGFVIYLSTQSDETPAGVFAQKLDYARGVRDGRITDKKFLPVIYEHPKAMLEKQEHLLPANFYVTNPNLGASVDEEFLTRELGKAQEAGEESLRGFLAKHLNVQIGLSLRAQNWAGAQFWESCGAALTLESLLKKCEVVTAGIDGGGLDDLLALVFVGRDEEGKWWHWARAWAHPIALERRKSEADRFRDFQRDGDLVIVDNMGEDVEQVADLVRQAEKAGVLDNIGVDPAGIGSIVDAITDTGIAHERIIGIPQGWKLTGAIKTTERRLAEGAMKHTGSRLMAWCVGNAKVEQKGNALVITKQSAGYAKIDPLMATFNAVALMAMNPKGRKAKYQMLFV
jgi:phage terminase large subunit-like protein